MKLVVVTPDVNIGKQLLEEIENFLTGFLQ